MTAINRRRFIQLTGGTAAFSMLSTSIAKAASIPAARRTGTLEDVEHIVVLMQENRSFDHYFGTLRGVRGFGDPRPVVLPSGKPVWYQSDGTKDVLPFHPDAENLGLQFLEDLAHDWDSGHQAWNNGAYDKWVPAKTATTMAHLNRADIPFHYALADAFTICDAYHCSLLTCTDPNRYYMWTGYTGNDGKGGGPVLDNAEAGYSWSTYPERLESAGVSWKIYQDIGTGLNAAGYWGWTEDAYIGNYGDNSLQYIVECSFGKAFGAKIVHCWLGRLTTFAHSPPAVTHCCRPVRRRPTRCGAGLPPGVQVAPPLSNDLDTRGQVCSACLGRRWTGRQHLSHAPPAAARVARRSRCRGAPRRRH